VVSSIYGVHPGVEMAQKWIAELKPKTGRTLEEWIAVVKKEGPQTEAERRDWLKTKHKHGTNSAWWIAARVEGRDSEEDSPEKYLAIAHYKGKLPKRLVDTGGLAKKDRITHRIELKSVREIDLGSKETAQNCLPA